MVITKLRIKQGEEMGLFSRKETNEQIVKRISANAGNVVNMFKAYFNTPKGLDATKALIFTSALAGFSCHKAVEANHEKFMRVTTNEGKNYYFGDDLNRYLLESSLSVIGFITVVTGITREEVLSIVAGFADNVGKEYKVCGFEPKQLYDQVSDCWEGIFENMTSRYTRSPSEWPILFGIVVQNILITALNAGAPKEEAGKIAIECAVAVSKMDRDSF